MEAENHVFSPKVLREVKIIAAWKSLRILDSVNIERHAITIGTKTLKNEYKTMRKFEETGMILLERGSSGAENNLWGVLKGTTDTGDR